MYLITKSERKLLIWKKKYQEYFNVLEDDISFDSFIKFPLLFFRIILFDFSPLNHDASLIMKIKFYAKKFFNYFCLVYFLIGMLQLLFYGVFNSDNFHFVVRAISDFSSTFLFTLKFWAIFSRKDDVQEIIVELKYFYESRANKKGNFKLKKYLDDYHRLVKVFIVNFIFGNLLFAIPWIPYLINGQMVSILSFWFPFNLKGLKIFSFVQLWTHGFVFLSLSYLFASDSLLYALLTLVSMEFDILKNNLLNLKAEKGLENELQASLADIIEYHNKLLKISDKLRKIWEQTFLFNFVISSLIMCIYTFQLSLFDGNLVVFLTYIIGIITIIIQIWLLCYYGQKLIDSSVGLADGIYESDWAEIDDNKIRKQIIIIMIRAQKPKCLTTMGFTDISLTTFTTVSFSIINLETEN